MKYYQWLKGNDCCQPINCGCSGKDVCDCDNILLEISKLHTDDEILQEEIDDLSGEVETKLDASAYTPVDLTDYYTKEEVDELIPEVPSLSGYATEQWVLDKHYITGVDLSDYATHQWVENKNYLTEHQPLKTINGNVISGTGNIEITCSGGSVTVDSELSLISTNPVQNKVITEALNGKLDTSAYTPTDLSNYVTISELTQHILNLQEQLNSLVSVISGCCGETGETLYRWVTMTGENDYWCSGTTKYSEEKEQSSTDGLNWADTGNIRSGSTVLEYNCIDCGYTPPTGVTKFSADYTNGTTYSIDCDYSSTLTTANTKPIGYDYTTMSSATIGNCINTISYGAFEDCESLTGVNISNSVTTIKNNAFNQCTSLQSINIPSGVTTIENLVFNNCSGMTSVTIPSGVTTIGSGAFNYCISLPSITIPNSVTKIMASAFEYCTSLQNVVIPSGVTEIGKAAFKNCSGLTSIIVEATTPPELYVGEQFDNTNCPIYVPSGSLSAYQSASGWSTYASRIQAI